MKYESGNAEKVNSKLNIEKTIYADRFMIENKEESLKLRNYVKNLREKIRNLEKCLSEYNNF